MKAKLIPRTAAIKIVRGYQWFRQGRPSPCRYWPSCSEYAVEALSVHGARKGTVLTARRIGRCHPWGGSGVDPVPEPNTRSNLRRNSAFGRRAGSI